MNPNPENSSRQYHDLTLKEDFRSLRLNFPHGFTWIRILPGLSSSAYGWLFPILALEFPGGRFIHPASFNPNMRSPFDISREWFQQHQPQSLYSKTNKSGFRLLPVQLCAFWAIEFSEHGTHSLRLVLESFHNGAKGTTGLAHEIWRKIFEKDENGQHTGDALHPKTGVMVCIERRKRKAPHPPLDWVQAGRIQHSLDDLLEKVSPLEKELVHPLEQVIHEPTLERTMGLPRSAHYAGTGGSHPCLRPPSREIALNPTGATCGANPGRRSLG